MIEIYPILSMSNEPGVEQNKERDKLLGVNNEKDIDPINQDVPRNSTVSIKILDKLKKQRFKFEKNSKS